MTGDNRGFLDKLRERGWLAPILQSLVVLTVWVLVAYLTIRLLSDDGNDANTAAPSSTTAGQETAAQPTTGQATADQPTVTPLEPTDTSLTSSASPAGDAQAAIAACQSRWEAQGRPLQSIHDAMEQWRLHINAMNRLVSGQITLDQATKYWKQTEVGAKANIHRFQDADLVYVHEAPQCARPASSVFDPTADQTLTRCIRAVRASDRVLEDGRIAVATWEHHVHDMEALMAGLITPEEASQAWLANWRSGNRELGQYDDSRQGSLRLQCL